MTTVLSHYNPPLEPFLDVLFQDDQILVVNKQSGILSVPGKPEGHKDSIARRAEQLFGSARVVHRLDMETSGIMVLGLNAESHAHLSKQFQNRKTQKSYVAVVAGCVSDDEGVIDLPLICDWPNRPRQKVDHSLGKTAITHFKVIERGANQSRLALFPETGRSHQLRVHCRAIGHPILGDQLYAPENVQQMSNRLLLHAEHLGFAHPTQKQAVSFTAPAPF